MASARGFSSEPEKEKRVIDNPVVVELADRIVKLNLLEVSDLTDLLRERLNLPASYGMPMMAAGPMTAGPAAAGKQLGCSVRERFGGTQALKNVLEGRAVYCAGGGGSGPREPIHRAIH